MLKTFRYRLFPTKKQITNLNHTLSLCCEIYNAALQERRDAFQRHGITVNYYDQSAQLPETKIVRPDLLCVHSQVLQNVLTRLDEAFKGFFRRVKDGAEQAGYPRFKSHRRYDSFTYPQSGFKIVMNKLVLWKIGHIRIKQHRPVQGKIKTCTVKRTSTGKWFVFLACETEPKPLPVSDEAIGVDVGLASFATFSDGTKVGNPRFFRMDEDVLANAQRKMSAETKGTPERQKRKRVVSRIHERITNRRENFAHQVSRLVVNQYGIVCVEDLQVDEMIVSGKNRKLSKSIGDVAWGMFIQFLTYKAEEAGRLVVRVNPRNTSKACSRCGRLVDKDLSVRVHECPECGFVLDRDHNAALNILRLGLQSLKAAEA